MDGRSADGAGGHPRGGRDDNVLTPVTGDADSDARFVGFQQCLENVRLAAPGGSGEEYGMAG